MREIKFRAWNKNRKQLVPVQGITWDEEDEEQRIQHPDHHINGIVGGSIGNYELMQYTGLKDIGDTEIYEGDIVAYDTEDGVCCAAVVWTSDVYPERDLSPVLGPGFILEDATHMRDYEENEDPQSLLVVGNIHENADLLS